MARVVEIAVGRGRSRHRAGALPAVRRGGGDGASNLEYLVSFITNSSIVWRENQAGADTRQAAIFCSLGDRVTNLSI